MKAYAQMGGAMVECIESGDWIKYADYDAVVKRLQAEIDKQKQSLELACGALVAVVGKESMLKLIVELEQAQTP